MENQVTVNLLKSIPSADFDDKKRLWLSEICYKSGKKFKTVVPEEFFIDINGNTGRLSWQKWQLCTQENQENYKHFKKQKTAALHEGKADAVNGSRPAGPCGENGKEEKLKIAPDKPLPEDVWNAITRTFNRYDIELLWKSACVELTGFKGGIVRRAGLTDRQQKQLMLALSLDKADLSAVTKNLKLIHEETLAKEAEYAEKLRKAKEEEAKIMKQRAEELAEAKSFHNSFAKKFGRDSAFKWLEVLQAENPFAGSNQLFLLFKERILSPKMPEIQEAKNEEFVPQGVSKKAEKIIKEKSFRANKAHYLKALKYFNKLETKTKPKEAKNEKRNQKNT